MRNFIKNIWLYSFVVFVLCIVAVFETMLANPNINGARITEGLGYAYGAGWSLLAIIHIFVLIFTKKDN